MDELNPHPDDATLFDLIEGDLEEAHARRVEAHLDGCAQCGAFVRAAIDGSPDTASPVEPMPADAVARMDVALAAAWRERTAAIAASEAREDAAMAATGPTAGDVLALDPLTRPAPRSEATAARPARRGWRRGLVPALAFVVLATLAGISLQVDTRDARVGDGATNGSADRRSDEPASTSSDEAAAGSDAADDAAAEADGDTAASAAEAPQALEQAPLEPEVERGAAAASPDAGADADPDDGEADPAAKQGDEPLGGVTAEQPPDPTATTPPPIGYEDFVDQDEICIATLDEGALVLPEGRIPQRIAAGPFGSYVVCG